MAVHRSHSLGQAVRHGSLTPRSVLAKPWEGYELLIGGKGLIERL